MHPGYAGWKFDKTKLLRRARAVVAIARELQKKHPIALAVCGTSGVWLASELLLNNFDVILVRKDSDRSHGYKVECKDSTIIRSRHIYFVDDLISSGSTLEYVAQALNKVLGELKGVILHDPNAHFFEGKGLYMKREYTLNSGSTIYTYVPNPYLNYDEFEATAYIDSNNSRP